MTENANEKTLKYRAKAVNFTISTHQFSLTVTLCKLDVNPYASAFAYGRKKLWWKDESDYWWPRGRYGRCPRGCFVEQVTTSKYWEPMAQCDWGWASRWNARTSPKENKTEIKNGVISALPFPDTFDAVTSIELFVTLRPLISSRVTLKFCVQNQVVLRVVTLVNRYALDGFLFLIT